MSQGPPVAANQIWRAEPASGRLVGSLCIVSKVLRVVEPGSMSLENGEMSAGQYGEIRFDDGGWVPLTEDGRIPYPTWTYVGTLRTEDEERLRQRCDYFDMTEALLSGERLQVTVRWIDRLTRARRG